MRSKKLESLERLASTLVRLPEKSPCLIDELSPNQVMYQLKNKKGCLVSQDEQTYFYLIEELGSFPCIQSEINDKKYSTRHRRITLFSSAENTFLQVRIAYLEFLEVCENKPIMDVLPGVLSWRYF